MSNTFEDATIQPIGIQEEMERSFLEYAMSVIVSRALPDVRDGLKPVHRRILYAMYDGGYRPARQFVKCSKVVGDVMGTYHPHGDAGIAVGMATKIPPHNMGEVIDAVNHFVDHPDATVEELMQFIKAPDFPTGGFIMGRDGVRDAYTTGRGIIRVRGKAEVEEAK